MSGTHKDAPRWVRRRRGQDKRTRRVPGPVPRRFVQIEFNRPERHAARVTLAHGDEPFPHQPRSRAHWDFW